MKIKTIGGPAHNREYDITPGIAELWIPIPNNSRAPKEVRRRGVMFLNGVYERTLLVRDGARIFRFRSGYYEAVNNAH